VKRMVWPRIVYWVGFSFALIGLLYGMTGWTSTPGLVAKSDTQTGGAVFALIGVLTMLGGKAWMDAIVRQHNRLYCPACGRVVQASAAHCAACGAPQRTTAEMLRTLRVAAEPTNGVASHANSFCPGCGAEAPAGATFCRACGRALAMPSAQAAP
jgi:hypothetical protein